MLPDRKRCFILDSCSSEAIQRSVGDIPRLERERERERAVKVQVTFLLWVACPKQSDRPVRHIFGNILVDDGSSLPPTPILSRKDPLFTGRRQLAGAMRHSSTAKACGERGAAWPL